ncbi:MAG: SDR family oxidoreductase [Alcanivorax sp.]|nr:SDR family oxidoreductase [Alcanivorax sp.]
MSKTVVITGANRGIGLALATRCKARGDHVIAACREPSRELAALDVTIVDGVDVSSIDGATNLQGALHGKPVDELYNCAGIMTSETLENMNFEQIEDQFQVNTLGPLRVTYELLDNLHSGSKVAMITSRMGSIEDNTSGKQYGYRISKAALNAASKSLAVDLKDKGVAVAILHPGWVQTEMTRGTGDLTTDQAAAGLMQRVEELNLENTGTFWHSNGSVLPW